MRALPGSWNLMLVNRCRAEHGQWLATGRWEDSPMETTERDRAIQALQTLPEHATLDDAIERLCFIAKIEEGLRQSDARELVPHEEVKKQFLS